MSLPETAPLTNTGPSHETMSDVSGLLVQQKFDLEEMICAACVKRNRYKIKGDDAWDPAREEIKGGFEEATGFKSKPMMMFAKEESTTCCRLCCGPWREFEMFIRPGESGGGSHDYRFYRPFKCTMLCCCFMINPPEIKVYDNEDKQIGQIVQDWRCMEALCCKQYLKVNDSSGNTQHFMRTDACNGGCSGNFCTSRGTNCCCLTHEIEILDSQQNPTDGYLRNIFPGCTCKGLSGLQSSYHLKFPKTADQNARVNLMAGMFLVEYLMFEQNQNENQG